VQANQPEKSDGNGILDLREQPIFKSPAGDPEMVAKIHIISDAFGLHYITRAFDYANSHSPVNPKLEKSSILTAGKIVETALTPALGMATQRAGERISQENFNEIVQHHQRRVYRVIYLLVRDADIADTLTQECFLRAYQKRESFRSECRIDTWLLRIAVNLVRDHGKNRRVSFWRNLVGLDEMEAAEHEPHAADPSAERVLLAREQLNAVRKALGSLSQQQREVFLLRFGEEMALVEIATVLGLQVGSVKAQLSRATSKLRELLKEGYGNSKPSE
jgi:RNA polymerase sigma-70 factor, ECF subfamily